MTTTFAVDRVHLLLDPLDFEEGVGGCQLRGGLVLVGSGAYVYFLRTLDTPSGSAATGYDPGAVEQVRSGSFPETVGRTGYACTLPGDVLLLPGAFADLLAATIATIPGVVSATVAGADNADGTRSITVIARGAVSFGARAWADRGAAGPHGGHVYRMSRTGETTAVTSAAPTLSGASAIANMPARAIPWCMQTMIGTTTSTADVARPRLSIRVDATLDATPVGSTVLDVGQVPASQIAAGQLATVFFTPAQVLAVIAYLDTVGSGRAWLAVHGSGACHVATTTLGAAGLGEQVNLNARFHGSSLNGNVAPPATWTEGGNAAVAMQLRLVYEIDPATTGERVWCGLGCAVPSASAPTAVGPLANQPVYTTGEGDQRLAGARVYEARNRLDSGTSRMLVHVGGSGTKAAPNSSGSTRLVDLGTNTGAGEHAYVAPTGSSAVYLPTTISGHVWIVQKASGAVGRGDVPGAAPNPAATLAPTTRPTSMANRTPATVGQLTMQEDRTGGGEDGNPATTSQSPTGGTEVNTNACPWVRLSFRRLPFALAA